jgi:hypothetical protein
LIGIACSPTRANRRLPALLEKSREAQTAVSTVLAEQVLGALHVEQEFDNSVDPYAEYGSDTGDIYGDLLLFTKMGEWRHGMERNLMPIGTKMVMFFPGQLG